MVAMGKYLITYKREGCITAGPCFADDPKHFKLNLDDGLADLVGGEKNPSTGLWEIEIDEADLKNAKAAAESCPVLIIHVFNKETGQKVCKC